MAEPEKKSAPGSRLRLRVVRQDGPDKAASKRTDEFEVEVTPSMTVHDCLEAIRRNPETVAGARVAPVVWDAPCLEESCGACTIRIDGVARLACGSTVASVSPKGKPITLEPLSKFRVERDLVVDKSPMQTALERVHAWVTLGDMSARAAIPRESQEQQLRRFELSACIGCGACLDACPEYQRDRAFVGAAAINRAHALNQHASGAMEKRKRVRSLMQDGGVADCGKAQACVDVCPKQIPLSESISKVARDATREMLWGWLAD